MPREDQGFALRSVWLLPSLMVRFSAGASQVKQAPFPSPGSQQSHGHVRLLPADRDDRHTQPLSRHISSLLWCLPGKMTQRYEARIPGFDAFACICAGDLCLVVNVLKPNVNLGRAGRGNLTAFVRPSFQMTC